MSDQQAVDLNRRVDQLYGQPWKETDYILALDTYFAKKGQPHQESSSHIQELATLLRRTPASICMRMDNFASLDRNSTESRRGLSNSGWPCSQYFHKWGGSRERLAAFAAVLRGERDTPDIMQGHLFTPGPVAMPLAFARYELHDLIGQGGCGNVYSCDDIDTKKSFAIKILNANSLYNSEALERFTREIRALQTVRHPHVIAIHDENLGDRHSFPSYVMDLADSTLADFLHYGAHDSNSPQTLSRNVAVTIVMSVTAALKRLHSDSRRIVHRDVNPKNILLLPDGRWVLADFGLSKFLDGGPSTMSFQTRTSSGWGTGYYAAPEQYRDLKSADERTDIYALGILIWELFTETGPPPDRQDSGMPAGLADVYLKASARKQSARFQSVAEFEEAFARALADGT